MGLLLQHSSEFLITSSNLFTHRDQTLGKVAVVLAQQKIRKLDKVYLLERQRSTLRELLLCLDECLWMFAPMPSGYYVVIGMIAVVKTMTVCLAGVSTSRNSEGQHELNGDTYHDVDQCNATTEI